MGRMKTVSRLVLTVIASLVVVIGSAGVASADEPLTWDSGEPMATQDVLLIFVGGPVALFVVIAVLSLMIHRKNYTPPPPSTDVETVDAHH